MHEMTLRQFVDRFGQPEAAIKLDMAQSSISKALKSGREIYVKEIDNGGYKGWEIKPFPSADFIRTPKTKKSKRA